MNTEVMKSLDDLDANLVLNKEVPIASVKVSAFKKRTKFHKKKITTPHYLMQAAARLGRIGDSWSMIRSPFGVLRRRQG